jgi:hypothetical protein
VTDEGYDLCEDCERESEDEEEEEEDEYPFHDELDE